MNRGKKPNILVIISDHFQSKLAGPDHPCKTPNINRITGEGMFFTNAYTSTAICAPARASLMTGLYPTSHGMYNNYHNRGVINHCLFDGVRIFPEKLKDAGYKNYYYGKWHVTSKDPRELGFDEFKEEYRYSHKNKVKNPPVVIRNKGYKDFPLYGTFDGAFEETSDYHHTMLAAKAIEEGAVWNEPWCVFCSIIAPHPPYVVPREFIDLYKDVEIRKPSNFDDDLHDKPAIYRRLKDRLWSGLSDEQCVEAIRHIYASSSMVDSLVGILLDKLDETKQADDTIVIFLSDHGELGGAHGMFIMGIVPFDETYRIPIAIRWPGVIKNPGAACNEFVRIMDIAPTILEAAGAEPLKNISGRSLVEILKGNTPKDWPKEAFCMFNGVEFLFSQRMIFNKKYKYVFNAFDFDELYDLEKDPGELCNLSENHEYQEIKIEMCKRMWRWMKKENDLYNNMHYPFQMLMPTGPDFE